MPDPTPTPPRAERLTADRGEIKLVLQASTGRPACVLLQAVFGGDIGAVHLFDTEDWIVSPVDDFRGYVGTRKEFFEVAARVAKKRPKGGWR